LISNLNNDLLLSPEKLKMFRAVDSVEENSTCIMPYATELDIFQDNKKAFT
jgi:hypothetical protein